MNNTNTLLSTLKQTAFALETVINQYERALGEVAVNELGLYLSGAKRAIERAESERGLVD